MRQSADFFVLLGQTLRRIDHQYADIGSFDGRHGPDNAVFFNVFINSALTPDSGGIDQNIFLPLPPERRVDGISGRSRNIGNDYPVFLNQSVDQRRFPHIGLADNSQTYPVVVLCSGSLRKAGTDLVKNISEIQFVGGGNRNRLSDSQRIKIIEGIRRIHRIVHLIDQQNHFFPGAPQHCGDFFICSGHAFLSVHHENDDVRHIHGDLRLLSHLRRDDLLAGRLNASRVNHTEVNSVPLRFCIYAVPGHAGSILDDGDSSPHDTVKKCRFPHIRASDHRHNRFTHPRFLP